jgi:hypothetical protein
MYHVMASNIVSYWHYISLSFELAIYQASLFSSDVKGWKVIWAHLYWLSVKLNQSSYISYLRSQCILTSALVGSQFPVELSFVSNCMSTATSGSLDPSPFFLPTPQSAGENRQVRKPCYSRGRDRSARTRVLILSSKLFRERFDFIVTVTLNEFLICVIVPMV